MKKRMFVLLTVCILFIGCSAVVPTEELPASTEQVQASASDAQIQTKNFVLKEDILQVPVEGAAPAEGIPYARRDAEEYAAKFAEAEQNQGVLPCYGQISLSILGELPTHILWYVEDGYDVGQKKEGSIAVLSQRTVTIPIGSSQASLVSGSFGDAPERKLRLVCQYPDRQMEYFLVLESWPTV